MKHSEPSITLPYSRQSIDEKDIDAVCSALSSDLLTTGPKVSEFEEAFAQCVDAKYAVAVSSGTAALHAAMYAIRIKSKDEVIVPAITFVASANCVVYQGGTPIITDVDSKTLLLDPIQVEAKITPRTKAIIAVDYAGHPCDYDALKDIAKRHKLFLVDDACHALGAKYKGKKVGALADITAFSFHPVKHITTGEGGMATTGNPEMAERMRMFRSHGITRNADKFINCLQEDNERQSWYYEMQDIGYNYRISDVQCALGLSQLQKLQKWINKRRKIAKQYDIKIAELREVSSLHVNENIFHAYHLYVIKFDSNDLRNKTYQAMRNNGIGVNVHYIPVHLHPYYRKNFGTADGLCPTAETAYKLILSLPMHQGMDDNDVEQTMRILQTVVQ